MAKFLYPDTPKEEHYFNESADSHNAVPSNRPDLGYDTLVGVQWNNHGTGISLNIPKADPNLVAYIQSHTGKGDFLSYRYTWNNNRIVGNQQPSPPRATGVQAPRYPQSALDQKNKTITASNIDLSGSGNIQAKSDKVVKERVEPIVQTGVGLFGIIAGVAACGVTNLGCVAGGMLIANGMDDVATGGNNYGKSSNEQTASLALTKGMGLSEKTAANVKLGADVVTGVGAGAVVKSGKYATSSTKANTASKHNAKLTTTRDGNLSVTHGLGYDAQKELNGIRAFLVENKKGENPFINNQGSHKGDPNKISIATATVTTKDGKTINYLAVSGKSWSGHAPDKVTIHGKEYQVLRNEAYNGGKKVLPDRFNPDNNQKNGNHAEKKLMSHITQQNQNGSISDVKINIQNTSKQNQGACYGCGGDNAMGGSIGDFKNLNPDITIHIEHGSTKTSK